MVLVQPDDHRVHDIALNATQGLARGMVVETNETELTVPIGKEVMGRMFHVFGNTIDHLESLQKMQRREHVLRHRPTSDCAKINFPIF